MAIVTDITCSLETGSLHFANGDTIGSQLDRRRFGLCFRCRKKVYSNRHHGHMTRDIRFGPWYTETFIITEWP